MAYFADLTPYSYIRRLAEPNVVNVGWLDSQHIFPKGQAPAAVLAKVFALCREPVNLARGMHRCQFCPEPTFGYIAERDGIKIGLGSGEIRVKGLLGIEYASPTMIYHYMNDHSYLPPQEFLEAISKNK